MRLYEFEGFDLFRREGIPVPTYALAASPQEAQEKAQEVGLPFSPGIMTPSDIEAALNAGVSVLKFFPAGAAGGVKMLKSLAAPYAHLGVRFIPTGGVSLDNVMDYLNEPAVLAAGGTWLAKKEDIKAGLLINALRVGLTGQGVAPGLFEVMLVLGRSRTLDRMQRLIEYLRSEN